MTTIRERYIEVVLLLMPLREVYVVLLFLLAIYSNTFVYFICHVNNQDILRCFGSTGNKYNLHYCEIKFDSGL